MVITISRQFAAGGAQVAVRVAAVLGWEVVDRALIDEVAVRAGVSADEVEGCEERTPGFLERLVHFTAAEMPDLFQPQASPLQGFEQSRLVKITHRLVGEVAARESVVIVGRASCAILAEHADTLHVRLVADRAFRVALACERLGIDSAEAEKRLDQTDLERARYLREYYDFDWADPERYDLVLHTGRLGIEGAAALVVARAREGLTRVGR